MSYQIHLPNFVPGYVTQNWDTGKETYSSCHFRLW